MLSPLDQQLLNNFQHDFPLSPTPYKEIARSLGASEDEVLLAFEQLNEQQFISRIGLVIPPNHLGVSSLVAMAVPPDQLQATASLINQHPEVNHNYERENHFNLWFVLMAEDSDHLQTTIERIETKTGFKAMRLPLLEDYYINLGFEIAFDD
ncbi:MAG: Lrp/AsnC family transcriptional regulator [Methylococcales bacterium]|nr:Lrp/AsnC family transcriptional regulator [Methylococcales bacterium]